MDPVFENIQVNIEELPHLGEVSFGDLENDYLKVTLISTLIFWVVISIAVAGYLLLNNLNYPVVFDQLGLGFLALLMLFSFWMVQRGFKEKAFALRQHDILYKKGVFWKSKTSIPFNRVQHCEVKEGPIDRMFNLSQLNIYTAGGSQSDLTIPGLKPDTSQKLKNYILGKKAFDESE